MPFFVQSQVQGRLQHAIEYGEPSKRMGERLGTERARLRISESDAARGIDALVAENFSEAVAAREVAYHGA